ncbi:MAG: DUF3786 domain-containing protein [Clostridiales Family XIII bacterium]|jgi:hypothetical protein|nr:DUF3786 domain-containing protein [Clostridiales Family XIII bacterium]
MTTQRIPLPDASERPSAAPMKHYKAIYARQDPQEISERTGLKYDAETAAFSLSLLGSPLMVSHPDFTLTEAAGTPRVNPYEQLLIIRYLTEGRYVAGSGKLVSYEELPWGSVYMQNFRGRVIGRLAREFGAGPKPFSAVVETMPNLRFERLARGDSSYRIEFIDKLFVNLIYYESDDEFPASFQVLFDDTIKYAFSAEDVAVVGDILIGRLKAHRSAIVPR